MSDLWADPAAFQTLRTNLETWEREAAAFWNSIIRSPDVLRRISHQINETLRAHQHTESVLRDAFVHAASTQETVARDLFALEQIAQKVDVLGQRVEKIERQLETRQNRHHG